MDDTLYEELIVPYKKDRKLSDLVIRLLTQYYYNEEVRNIVDEVEGYQESNNAYDEYFRDIRAMVACMSTIQDSAESTIIEGTQNILNKAERREHINESAWGESVPKLSKLLEASSTQNCNPPIENKQNEEESRIKALEEQIQKLTDTVLKMSGSMQNGVTSSESQSFNNHSETCTENMKIDNITSVNNDKINSNEQSVYASSISYENYNTSTPVQPMGYVTNRQETVNTDAVTSTESQSAGSGLKSLKKLVNSLH